VACPSLEPKKDYNDYAKYINEIYTNRKLTLLQKSTEVHHRRSQSTRPVHHPIMTLRTKTNNQPSKFVSKYKTLVKAATRKNSVKGSMSDFEKSLSEVDVQPYILEGKLSEREDFLNLSDGFKKVFLKEKMDQKLVLPISGYGGHRRGDKS
jgi:hypothetical protein